MRVLVTGAAGFLGWHTRVRVAATTDHELIAVDQGEWSSLHQHATGVDAVIHLAGINRASDDEVRDGNARLAEELVAALPSTVRSIVYANSVQAGNGTPYGEGKARAAAVIRAFSERHDVTFTDVLLPNLFGEHGRADYNSFVATFANRVVEGAEPRVVDREVELLHVQEAADVLLSALEGPGGVVHPRGTIASVAGVLETLRSQFAVYRHGEIPHLGSRLELALFNTLRTAMFPRSCPLPLVWRTDERGGLVEVVRAHGSAGQTFLSHTHPGVTRGQHMHLRKVERFVVVNGEARIELRRALTDQRVSFDVTGDDPVAVDMPTGWYHSITNTGSGLLTTVFWTSELFDPEDPDTYPGTV